MPLNTVNYNPNVWVCVGYNCNAVVWVKEYILFCKLWFVPLLVWFAKVYVLSVGKTAHCNYYRDGGVCVLCVGLCGRVDVCKCH